MPGEKPRRYYTTISVPAEVFMSAFQINKVVYP